MPEHSKSEPPGSIPLDKWRDQISTALRPKYDDKLPPEHLERAIDEVYAAKCTYVEQFSKTKSDSRPSEKKREQLERVYRSELLPSNFESKSCIKF